MKIALVAVLMGGGAFASAGSSPVPVEPATVRAAATGEHAAGAEIRYAVQRTCGAKTCGKLRLVLGDGSSHELPDTATGEGHEPVAVSADGRHVAYFRERDRRLVTYELGGKRRLVGSVRQPVTEVGADGTRLVLSPGGTRLAYVPNDTGRRIRVYDVRSGRLVGTLAADDSAHFAGFSGDGGEVLRVEDRPVTAVVTGLRGRTLRRQVPPRVVARNLPLWHAHPRVFDGRDDGMPRVAAPAADGRRLAVYVPGSSMAVYDMKTRGLTARIRLPGGVRPATAAWTGADEVTVRGSAGRKVHRIRVDVAEKTAEIVETFAGPGGAVYHAGG